MPGLNVGSVDSQITLVMSVLVTSAVWKKSQYDLVHLTLDVHVTSEGDGS